MRMTATRRCCVAAFVLLAWGAVAQAQIPRDTTPVVAKTSPADLAAGKERYEATCSKCHGLDGGGSDGPSLQGVAQRIGDEAVGNIIRGGIPGTGMNGFGSLSLDETGQIVGYLRTLGRTADAEIAKGNPDRGRTVYESSGC